MITAIREVRRARGLTLDDVARRCDPPTTAQTIGRLETGMRTVSVDWLNRIARALEVEAADLVHLPDRAEVAVAATIGAGGVAAPASIMRLPLPRPDEGSVAVTVAVGVGDYRAGDVIWCVPLAPEAFAGALNRDVLVPRGGGRFAFGRLIAREGARLQIAPPGVGARQQVVNDPPWMARATTLIRAL